MLDYKEFKSVAYMVKSKEHLTLSGIKKILEIKARMNG